MTTPSIAPTKTSHLLPCDGTGEIAPPKAEVAPLRPRFLTINQHLLPLSGRVAAELLKAGLIYECGGGHDLRVMPEGPYDAGWEPEHVLRLVAILLGLGAEVRL